MFILNDTEKKSMIANEKNEFELWHKRLGHVSAKRLQNMSNNDLVHGLPKFNRDCVLPFCDPCCKAKFTRTVMPMRNPTFNHPLELVPTDVDYWRIGG